MSKMDLGSSLTTMDWLARLRVGQAGPGAKMEAPNGAKQPPRPPTRKPPPSPIDLTACLDPVEAQAYRYHDAKPPYSYAALITYAINSTSKKRLTLSDIYNWISTNFPYYRDAGTGWKVRADASLEQRKVSQRCSWSWWLWAAPPTVFCLQSVGHLRHVRCTVTQL